jgi:hypothetical protein
LAPSPYNHSPPCEHSRVSHRSHFSPLVRTSSMGYGYTQGSSGPPSPVPVTPGGGGAYSHNDRIYAPETNPFASPINYMADRPLAPLDLPLQQLPASPQMSHGLLSPPRGAYKAPTIDRYERFWPRYTARSLASHSARNSSMHNHGLAQVLAASYPSLSSCSIPFEYSQGFN